MTSQTIPDRWKLTKISKIAVKGQQRKPDAGEQFTYVDIGSIDRNQKKIADPQTLNGSQAPSRARKVIEKGDVLVSLTRPNLNAVALVSQEYHNQIASTGFEVVRPLLVDSRYIFALVRSKQFVNAISGTVQGALYPAAKSADVQNFELPLPSLAEQKVIADKLDALLAQVESTKARLDRIPQILKRFRQSILAAAVNGRLTNSESETFSIVLVEELAKPEKYSLGIGPFGSNLKVADYREEGHPLIFVREIRANRFGDDATKFVSDEKFKELKAHRALPGDILITKMGDPPGDVTIYPASRPEAVITADCIKLSVNEQVAVRDYVAYAMQSKPFRNDVLSISAGVAQQKVNLTKFRKLTLPLPSIEEQTEIVRRVDQLFAYADRIEQQINNALERVNNLTQSILAKAFRGELTEQWRKDNPELISGDNSAEALLERIKAERAAIKPAKRSRKKTNA